MENASKALIIAGAILLSIAIIGIGMYVYSQAEGVMKNINMSQQEVAAYNATFINYEGTQNGAAVRTLCDIIRNHNLTNVDDPSRNVNLKKGKAEAESAPISKVEASTVNDIKKDINAGKKYTVTLSYDKHTGLIVEVGIDEKK